jgi:two-component system CheB/CheR fusion protein
MIWKIIPNNAYIVPYNKGIEVTDSDIKLIPRSSGGPAISIDKLFSSFFFIGRNSQRKCC